MEWDHRRIHWLSEVKEGMVNEYVALQWPPTTTSN
jgi:hypothetical protein